MLELLAPAGSMDAVRAAVQNGADAVYLGSGSFNARMGARNFSREELCEAVTYCHIRGAAVHLTLNTLAADRELPAAAELIRAAAEAGVDAFIVQDLGLVSLCRQIAPDVAIHGSTQMSIHSLEGIRAAAELGCSRVVLARELPEAELEYLCRSSPVEIEVFVHGALCMCYSGQCYLSSVIGQRSGNRGRCAQPCRLPYGVGRFENKYPLSLKDNCLVEYLSRLKAMGVASLKIEGRMKRPEYVAIATRIYRTALEGKPPTEEQMAELRAAFSRQGFTDGYFRGAVDASMLGIREAEAPDRALLARARATYETGEVQRVPVRFYAVMAAGQPMQLAAEDDRGHRVKRTGPVPEPARTRGVTEADLAARLSKTGGTPYAMVSCRAKIDPDLTLSAAAINAMRRNLLDQLTAVRGRMEPPRLGQPKPLHRIAGPARPAVTVSIHTAAQLTPKLLALRPAVLYVPLPVLCQELPAFSRVAQRIPVAAVLPRVIPHRETAQVVRQLDEVHAAGITQALVGNLGHITLARSRGFDVRGDYGLNLFNSRAMDTAKQAGLLSATASFELGLGQIRDLSKPLDTELLAYGRLPLMLTEHCLTKNRTGACTCSQQPLRLVDRKGAEFFVVRDAGTCRNEILNGKKLYLLDKPMTGLGLWALRLRFTTESPAQVDAVLRAWEKAEPFDPGACTRGLYLRKVE